MEGPALNLMEHDEFVAKSGAFAWGVRGVAASVRAVWGGRGFALYFLACLLALAPLLVFGLWCAALGRYVALVWMVPAAAAFLRAPAGLNVADGMPWLACGIVALIVSLWAGPVHLLGGAVVVATWILTAAVRGTTMVMLEGRLRASKDAYEQLRDSGNLIPPRPPANE